MITLKELVDKVWYVANILRGDRNVCLNSAKNYLLRLLLLKRLSDLFEEAEAIKHQTGNRALLALNSQKEHRFFIPKGYRWSDLKHIDEYVGYVGDELNKALAAIEYANPEFQGIFVYTDNWQRVSDMILLDLIRYFSNLNLRNSNLAEPDLLGHACEELIERFALNERAMRGSPTTPRQVAKLMVRLIEPQEGMQICDPVCGTGSLLVECRHQIEELKGNPSNVSLYGQAPNSEAWATAKINLLLHNIFDFDIRLGETLREPKLVQKDGKLMLFDRVITNPPFNRSHWRDEIVKSDKDIYNRFRYGIPPYSNGNYAFIQHIIATLKETGRAAVLVPHGVLFCGGAEAKIRIGIIRDDLIEAVISLAPKLFFGTSISAAILVLNRNKQEDRRGKILFIDASCKYQAGKIQNYLRDEDIDYINSAYCNFQDEVEYAKVVSCEELAANDYILDIKRYITPPKIEANVEAEIKKLFELKTERARVQSEMDECLRTLGIK